MSSSRREPTPEELAVIENIQTYQHLRQLESMEGWRLFVAMLNRGILYRQERICDLLCGSEETNRLRGEIMLLRKLKDATSIDNEKIAALERELEGLRTQADARHDLLSVTRSNQP